MGKIETETFERGIWLAVIFATFCIAGCDRGEAKIDAAAASPTPEPVEVWAASPTPAPTEARADAGAVAQPAPSPPVDCAGYVAGSAEVPAQLLGCSIDDDCTLAEMTCCPCSASGERIAVAVDHAACITPGKCPPLICAATDRCDEFGVACRDGVCTRIVGTPDVRVQTLD